MLSSLRLALARPAFRATRAFSATPRVADDVFVRPSPCPPSPRALQPTPRGSPRTDRPSDPASRQMRGIPFQWERVDLEEFIKEQGIKFEKISLPPSDRRKCPPPPLSGRAWPPLLDARG